MCIVHCPSPARGSSRALQYRMNEPIMALSNAVVYQGQLKCASESVGSALLELPAWDSLAAAQPRTPAWLSEVRLRGSRAVQRKVWQYGVRQQCEAVHGAMCRKAPTAQVFPPSNRPL